MTLSRRDLIRAGAAAALASPLLGLGHAPSIARPRRRAIRFAHMTDFHCQPERRAREGMAAALAHVSGLRDRPELILTGGDLIMDSFEQGDARTAQQWDLFTKTLRDETPIAVEHCLGNHDIWGWNKAKSGTTGDEPGWGKARAIDILGLPGAYHTFDRAGWTFIILDSVRPDGTGYKGRLDDEQFEWLEGELARATTPVAIVSHISILAGCVLVNSKADAPGGDHRISGGVLHQDVKRLRDLFGRHSRVKLCLSGHMHLIDRVDYNGVAYICDGAVSGNWWKGRHQECDEGYGVIDLFDDGTFAHEYTRYGWKAEA